MAINSLYSNYIDLTNNSGTAGFKGGVELSYEDDILTFTEADGDTYKMDAKNLSDADIEQLAGQLGGTIKGAEKADATNGTTEANAEDGDLEANKAKMTELQTQREGLQTAADTLKSNVEKISDEIEKSIEEALDKEEKATADEQKRINNLVQEEIKQFKKDKENGKDVTVDDLQQSIKTGMAKGGFDEEMQNIVSGLLVTNTKMNEMDVLLTELGTLNNQIKDIDNEMETLAQTIEKQEKEAEEAAKKAAQAAASSSSSSCCDPIGFKADDGNKYEFVIDKDENGELSNFSEFLGSENFFDEMKDLDADGDGNVNKEEMEKAGVKVLVTDAEGNQTMQSLADAFGEDAINVDLNSYNEAAEGEKAENGQTLLGNFNINVGDSQYEGYSTLDTEEYLTSNYKFSDENPVNAGINVDKADGATKVAGATTDKAEKAAGEEAEANELDAFIEDYTARLEKFHEEFQKINEILGLDEELIDTMNELAKTEGTAAANQIIKEAKAEEAKEEKEAEKAQKAEEEKEAEKEKEEEEEEKAAA